MQHEPSTYPTNYSDQALLHRSIAHENLPLLLEIREKLGDNPSYLATFSTAP